MRALPQVGALRSWVWGGASTVSTGAGGTGVGTSALWLWLGAEGGDGEWAEWSRQQAHDLIDTFITLHSHILFRLRMNTHIIY